MTNPKNLRPPWKKGQPSPNPKGRPRKAETMAEYKRLLVNYFNEPDKSNRDRYVELIRKLERHKTGQKLLMELLTGKPIQAVDVTSGGKPLNSELSDDQRRERMKELAVAIAQEVGKSAK